MSNRDVTVTSKFAGKRKKKTEESPDRILLRPGTVESVREEAEFVSNLVDSELDVVAESPKWVDKSAIDGEVRSFRSESTVDPVTLSGWMELEGVDEDELVIGDNVTLVVRLRQGLNHDTMVSKCVARGVGGGGEQKSGSKKQDLTDHRGCPLDTGIMGAFASSFNARTGVKILRSSFPIFKFSGMPELVLQCAVLVCDRACPPADCAAEVDEEADRLEGARITHKFVLSTKVSVAGSKFVSPLERRRRKKEPTEEVRRAATFSKAPAASSLLREEERNEVDEAYVEQQVLHQLESASSAEGLLCLSPSRLILAFGVILFILLLALVFACMLWMRARAHSRRPKPPNMKAPPPPHPMIAAGARPAVVPAPPPPPPHPPGVHQTVRRGPAAYLIRGKRMPYIRVVH